MENLKFIIIFVAMLFIFGAVEIVKEEKPTRIIIAGSRNYSDYTVIKSFSYGIINKLNLSLENIEIISGGCYGVDKLAEKFADESGFIFTEFPANWSLGKRAGYERNKQMAKYAAEENGILIAFWDYKSKGTKLMLNLAKEYGLKRYVININTMEFLELLE